MTMNPTPSPSTSTHRRWTFGRRVASGFAATVLLTILIDLVSIYALRVVVSSKDRVINVNAQILIESEQLNTAMERKASALRGYLFARDERFVDELRAARIDIVATLARLRAAVRTDEGDRDLDQIERAETEHQQVVERLFAMRRANNDPGAIIKAYEVQLGPKRDELEGLVKSFVASEQRILQETSQASTDSVTQTIRTLALMTAIALFLAIAIAFLITRALTQQVGTSVGRVQSSSAELQAAATQQATGAKEQATAMNEITTTITELMATSRQISESAQRVSQVAQQATTSARSGDTTVDRGNDAIVGTRKQIDLVVGHILDLGKKSQQIGAVLDIVSELAEQTNILSINASIEAAGAGESGKRFAVVAEEIRKLADRVAGSTKEIRTLIDDVRGAVNTTVMTTETGSKSVDQTAKQFGDIAAAFRQIATLVATTLDAAREIELSTKQQATAVEQVNLAISNVSQATRETETSSAQTLQTASQLATLSRDLLRLVRAEA
jgi:methyl-accepting chemotaxis protein